MRKPFYLTSLHAVWDTRELTTRYRAERGALDSQIVDRARKGDLEALEKLLKLMTPPLLRLATRLTADAALAEELVQEALYRGSVKLRSLRKSQSADAWFRRILVNLWRDGLRSRRPRALLLEDFPEPSAPASFEPEAVAGAHELEERVARALASLPPGQRAVVVLRIDEDLTVAEIAEVLETTAERVKANLWHARRRLRRLLGDFLGERNSRG